MPYYNHKQPADIHLVVKEAGELMSFLIQALPKKNRNNIKTMLKERQVEVNGTAVTQFNHPLQAGQKIIIRHSRGSDEKSLRGITILHEDAELIAIDKHAGILSVPSKSSKHQNAQGILQRHVRLQGKRTGVFPLQRLERESSGVMLFACNENLQKQFLRKWDKLVQQRSYLVVVEGTVEAEKGEIRSYINESGGFKVSSSQNSEKGELAETSYKVLKRSALFSMLEVHVKGGKKDQIRVHMVELGHPVIGDLKYGSQTNPSDRLGLHAWKLTVQHPVTEDLISIEAPVPRKLSRLF